METMETNVVFPEKSITRKMARSVESTSYTINANMTNEEKLKIIKAWWEEHKVSKEFNLFLVYNEKTYNLYSYSLKGNDFNIYFTYSDETTTHGYGMLVVNIDNEFPTFVSDRPEFDISTLVKQEGTGGTGTNNYDELENKPSINDIPLVGNLTSEDLGISGDSGTKQVYIFRSNMTDEEKIALGKEYYANIDNSIALYEDISDKKFSPLYYYSIVSNNTGLVLQFIQIRDLGAFSNLKYALRTLRFNGINTDNWTITDTTNMSYGEYANVDKVLLKTNTESFTPTNDYNPATKKYVDDSIASISGDSGTKQVYILNRLTSNDIIIKVAKEYYANRDNATIVLYSNGSYYNLSYAKVTETYMQLTFYGITGVSSQDSNPQIMMYSLNFNNINTNNWSYSQTNSASPYIANTNNVLTKTNGVSYTPTGNYNPATKKYVDDQVGNINTLLEAI